MTVAIRQWSAKGGSVILGRVVPGIVGCIGTAALAGAVALVRQGQWREAPVSIGFFVAIAAIAAWLLWKFLRTVWLIVLADETFTCIATGGRWTFGPGEILAVRGDVYHQFLHVVGTDIKVVVWAQFEGRDALFASIRRLNPAVEFSPWIQPSSR